MVCALVCVSDAKLNKTLAAALREQAARFSEDEWRILDCRAPSRLEETGMENVDLLCCDLTGPGWLEELPRLRETYRRARLMLLSDGAIPPQAYLRPRILPSSLLVKPFTAVELRQVTEEFVRSLTEDMREDKRLLLKTREGKVLLPYERILYLEAREKKICARLPDEEYVFYHTIDKLQEELPPSFLRVHRSYLVNGSMIEQVRLSEGMVRLRHGVSVPLSRKYRQAVKEYCL